MKILVDADALPGAVKELLFKAAERERVSVIIVANKPMRMNGSPYISSEQVALGPDVADDRIVELVEADDLVITADIPLADRVVSKGAAALDPRGRLYNAANIKDVLSVRDLMNELRSGGMIGGGPAGFNARNRQAFANELNSYLIRRSRARG